MSEEGAIGDAPKKRLKQGLITDSFHHKVTSEKCDKLSEVPVKCNQDTRSAIDTDTKMEEGIEVSDSSADTEDYNFESTAPKMAKCLGVDISEFKRTPQCAHSLPSLQSSPNHHVLFKVGSTFDEPPKPLSDIYNDKWDDNFVRMPCSPESKCITEKSNGERVLESRWDLIRRSLSRKINSSYDLENAIFSYNGEFKQGRKFSMLHHLFLEVLKPEETDEFFQTLLPRIIRLALQLPYLCTEPIPLLQRNSNHTISLSQLQISSLLANAFLCTFPWRNRHDMAEHSAYSNYPRINFNELYSEIKKNVCNRKLEKLKCLLHYFRKVTDKEPCGVVSFERKFIDGSATPVWITSKRELCKLIVSPCGTIEVEGSGMMQMDFANKFVGGGVLRAGCVQEEIRFITCPDLIASMLFTEQLDSRDAMVITGSERCCSTTGYADSFKFAGDFQDKTPLDSWGRRYTEVVVLDAKPFKYKRAMQFEPHCIEREVVKAFCGFFAPRVPAESLSAVATGNWGCGAFMGDPRLKSLIQLIAATEAGRDVLYFTFNDSVLSKDIYNMYKFLTQNRISVGNLWALLLSYHCTFRNGRPKKKLYNYIIDTYYENSTAQDRATRSVEGLIRG